MAFSVPASSSNSATIYGTSGLAITKPTGLQDDDILYAILQKQDDLGGDFACSGWTVLAGAQTTASNDMSSTVLRKVISDASSEGASYTFTNSDTNSRETGGVIVIVRGGDTSTPEDATTTEAAGTNDDTPDSPSITTNTDGALVLAMQGVNNSQGGDSLTIGAPSGYTLGGSDNTAGSGRANVAIAYLVKASADATGALTWTNTPDSNVAEWHTYTVAVKPGSAGPAAGRGRHTYQVNAFNQGIQLTR